MSPFQVVRSTNESMANFKLATSQGLRPHRLTGPNLKKLKLPDEACPKMNWDAALCSSIKMMGVGAVLQDEHGVVFIALVSVTLYNRDPTVAEATTLWKTVKLYGELGCQWVVFERDSM